MADTTNFAWTKPTVGGDSGAWGTILNTALDDIDADLNTVKTTADGALPKAGGTMTGALEFHTTRTKRVDLGSPDFSGATTLDFAVANAWEGRVNGNVTFSLANVPAGTVVVGGILRLRNGGAFTVTWPVEFQWPGGTAPTLTASGTDVIAFVSVNNGASFQAVAHLNFS